MLRTGHFVLTFTCVMVQTSLNARMQKLVKRPSSPLLRSDIGRMLPMPSALCM